MWLIKNQFIVIRAATKLKNLFRIMNALQSSEFQVKMKSMWLFENVIELFNIWIESMLFVWLWKRKKTAFDFNLFCFFLHFKFIWLGCSTENVVCCSVNFEWFIFTWKENWKYILYFVCLHNLVRWTEFEPLRNVMPASKWKRLRSSFAMFENSREYLLNGYCLYRATRTKIKQLKWKKLKEPTHTASLNKTNHQTVHCSWDTQALIVGAFLPLHVGAKLQEALVS